MPNQSIRKISFFIPIALSLAAQIFFSSNAMGQGISFAKYSNDFLSIGIGGRALGMGSAYTAVANDVTAGYWNPAGLAGVNFPEIMLMHDQRYSDIVSYNYGAVALPLTKTETVALSAIVLSVSGIPNTLNALINYDGSGILDPTNRLDYSKITFFSATDVAVIGSYAKKAADNFSFGANVKFIRRSIGSTYGTGLGFDVGALYTPFKHFRLGANLQNATTTVVAWTTGTTELTTPTLATGAAYLLPVGPVSVTPALDLLFNIDNLGSGSTVHLGPLSADANVGMEVNYKNVIAIRAGYNDVKQFTIGAGIHLPKLLIDYSFARFAYADALGDTHRISLELVLDNSK